MRIYDPTNSQLHPVEIWDKAVRAFKRILQGFLYVLKFLVLSAVGELQYQSGDSEDLCL